MKTAVEFLEERLQMAIEIYGNEFPEIIKQAKEMEKQQIIEAHGDKQKIGSNPGSLVTYGYNFSGIEYYNKTFKSE